MLYEIISNAGGSSITVLNNGRVFTADNTHPNFARIVECAAKDDDAIFDLFDTAAAIQAAFDRVSERVSIRHNVVYFDGEPVDNTLTQQIVRFRQQGISDYSPLVNFYEKVMTNRNARSREQLFTWLSDRNFTITADGDFIAYKGVRTDGTSIHAGPAVVDGQPVNGHVPNEVGSIVEMPRNEVNANADEGCSYGLHAGTWEYASSFGPMIVTVKINPRDVVSVPRDCDFQKLRTCRYEVLEIVENPDYTVLAGYDHYEDDDSWDEDDAWATLFDGYEQG